MSEKDLCAIRQLLCRGIGYYLALPQNLVCAPVRVCDPRWPICVDLDRCDVMKKGTKTFVEHCGIYDKKHPAHSSFFYFIRILHNVARNKRAARLISSLQTNADKLKGRRHDNTT